MNKEIKQALLVGSGGVGFCYGVVCLLSYMIVNL